MLINLNHYLKQQALQGFELLPLFYVLPKPLVYTRKMDKFPRNPFVAVTSPKWRELYHTQGWQAEVADLWALTIWPDLGIRGGISNYSYHDPFVRLAYTWPLWAALLADVGISLDSLAMMPDDAEVQYLSEEQTDSLCRDLAKLFWHDPNIKAKQIWEIVKRHRAHDDFAERKSTVRIDFYRRYYHTRNKIKSVALEEVQEEAEYIADIDFDFENVIANDWIEKFYGWLGNKKDIEICKLLYIGCTQQQIAERLGYKGNSGVAKRVAYIREILEAFVEWQKDLEQDNDAPPPPKLKAKPPLALSNTKSEEMEIRYDVIDFSYRRKNIFETGII